MDLRLKFNEDAANYDRWRPTYVPELFARISQAAGLDASKTALEIGLGTGQATRPLLETGCRITAIELGENLAAYARHKFAAYPNLDVIQADFVDYDPGPARFDLVYSATAFHWIPEDVGYPRVFELLKPGGVLALFWNHPFPARPDDPIHSAFQAAYAQYWPSARASHEFTAEDCQPILDRLARFGFVQAEATLLHGTRRFAADEYIALLNTYSDHRALAADAKAGLEAELAAIIERHGGRFQLHDTIDLYLARKP